MNITPVEIQPFSLAPFAYPSVGRALLDSVLTIGRTALITVTGFSFLIGSAVAIAVALTTVVAALGYDASVHY
jgi:hypothetical protein